MSSRRSAPLRTPAVLIATLIATTPLIGCGGSSDDGPDLIVTNLSWAPSQADRVEVRFTVENPSEGSRDLECDVHAFDADGFDAGRDRLSGETIMGTLGAEAMGDDGANVQTYRTVTGIDADDVVDVKVEC